MKSVGISNKSNPEDKLETPFFFLNSVTRDASEDTSSSTGVTPDFDE